MKFGFSVEWAWGSALRAGVLSSCFAKKKVAKEEGDPRVGVPCGDPLRYSKPAGAAELGPAGLRQSSPFIRRFLRCSAPLMGTREASRNNGSARETTSRVGCNKPQAHCTDLWHLNLACRKPRLAGRAPETRGNAQRLLHPTGSRFSSQLRESPIVGFHRFGRDALPGPLRGAEQRRNAGGRRRGLSEGRSPEFRSRPAFRVAQGTPAGGTDPGSPFLCVLSFGEAKESTTPRKGGTLTPNKLTTQRSRERSEGSEATPSRCNALRLLPPTGLNNPSPDRKNCQSSATA
jgi:hypothetical protein